MIKKIKHLFSSLSDNRAIDRYIALWALCVSLVFCFFIAPFPYELPATGVYFDGYGSLAYNLWHHGTFSRGPDLEPSVLRGPVYPALLAISYKATGGWNYSAQLVQSVLHALTAFTVFRLGFGLFGRNTAVSAAALYSVHPFFLWYSSQIRLATLSVFLFVALCWSITALRDSRSAWRFALTGFLAGTAALAKATFLPFVVLVPMLVLWTCGMRKKNLALVCLAAGLLTVAPWTIRNFNLTGQIVPVHTLAGFNIRMGDGFLEYFPHAPLSHRTLFLLTARGAAFQVSPPKEFQAGGWRMELYRDAVHLDNSLAAYAEHPWLLPKKILLNVVLFWFLGDMPAHTLAITLLQIPLLAAFAFGSIRALRKTGVKSAQGIVLFLLLVYYLEHLPIFAFFRLSVVLVPVMLIYAASLLHRKE